MNAELNRPPVKCSPAIEAAMRELEQKVLAHFDLNSYDYHLGDEEIAWENLKNTRNALRAAINAEIAA